ncbi:hypothetical protein DSLASN_03650 [Desulfoluna limicola]|uniref:OmpA-like domain-containing protein n=1 Tax=Desulfoluna limicola TaxID=2810562 RepID=A0ABM7PC09_9BACT|nr:DUF748 domain-containing protein [Desulfoluna limicola]BCS94733.1 hypothetical protein DSLASN_03650 [Desulfoluna limicola]
MTVKIPTTLNAFLGSRAAIIISGLAVLFLAILTAIPFAVKHGATSWLLKNGMSEAHIDNVDINPFAGTFAIEGLQLHARSGETSSLDRLAVNIAMTGFIKKHVGIESLHLEGLNVVVDLGDKLTIGGLVLPEGETTAEEAAPTKAEKAPENPWLIGIDALSINDTSVALSIPKLALRMDLDEVSLTSLHAWTPEQEALLEIKGAVNQSPLLMSLDLTPFALVPAIRGGIQLQKFSLNRFDRMAEPHITALRGEVSVDTRIDVTHDPKRGTTFSQIGTLSVGNLGGIMEAQGVDLNTFDITWLGDIWASVDANGALTDLRTMGRLANTRLDTVLKDRELQVHHEGLIWDGEMRFQPQLDDGLTVRGNLSLKNASSTDTASGNTLTSLSNLFVYDIKARGLTKIRTPHIALKGLKAMPPLAGIGSIDLTGIALENLSTLRAETFIIGDVTTTIERDADGTLSPLKNLEALAKYQTAEPAPEPSEAAPLPAAPAPPEESAQPSFTFKIGTFRIKGDELILFTDHSVTPAFKKNINLKRFELLGIDSSAPEKDVPLTLEAELGTYETIFVNGTVRPFDPGITANLDASITNINLAPLSPYSSQALGYLTETGTFTIESKVKINAGVLDTTNKLILHKLELVPDDEGSMDRLMKTLTMPLDYAFSILEDSNETITLDIPVEGDINNPDVSLDSIIQIAMTKAITTASVSYLSYMLQPYGAVLMVAESAGEFITQIRLDPVFFDVGAVEPNQAGLDYLKMVAGLMKKKEVLKLTVCANAVTEDIVVEVPPEDETQKATNETAPPAQDEITAPVKVDKALYLALARQRAEAIRDILLEDGINARRIILCHPHFTVSEQKKPQALLTL